MWRRVGSCRFAPWPGLPGPHLPTSPPDPLKTAICASLRLPHVGHGEGAKMGTPGWGVVQVLGGRVLQVLGWAMVQVLE